MESLNSILEQVGLTKTETKIYLSLLKLGQSTTTAIVRDARIHAAKVYEYLDKLVKKGLVSYVIKSNRKHFTAAPPEALSNLLKEKKEEISEQEKTLQAALPKLNALRSEKEGGIKADIYEGLQGIKSVYENILKALKKGGVQYAIGAPRIGNELIEGYLLEWHKKRIRKGIRCQYIYDSDVRDYGSVRERMPLTKVRYLPDSIVSPVWIEIFADRVVIGHIKGRDALLFVIRDQAIAESYMDYFRLIWRICRA